MHKRIALILLLWLLAAVLSGCTLLDTLQGGGTPTAEAAAPAGLPTAMIEPSATPALAPTLPAGTLPPTATIDPALAPPTLEGGATPTEIPPPTEIGAPEGGDGTGEGETGDEIGGGPQVSGPGISIDPALGEPGELIMVNGDGFDANTTVYLYWAGEHDPSGEVYWEEETDANGSFQVGLYVPAAEKWPGGAPEELEIFQLRATTEKLGDFYYFANFRYLPRFDPYNSLVLTYTSPDYGYEIDVPNLWVWDDEEATNVRFTAPSGVGYGFVRVVGTANVSTAIQSVMPVEAPGEGYKTENTTLAGYSGTQVNTDGGLIVWFIHGSSRVYALTFVDDNGAFYAIIANSFRLK